MTDLSNNHLQIYHLILLLLFHMLLDYYNIDDVQLSELVRL